jgi:hypothetical protein
MSALLHSEPIYSRPRLSVVPALVSTPPLVTPAVYRRRRIAAVGLVALIAVTVWVVAQSVAGVFARSEATQPMEMISATHPVTPVVGDQYWTVRPGDTLWSIAQAVHPKGDFRPVLKRLDDRYGSTPLLAGQNILVS